MKAYQVTLKFQYPAYDEVDGITEEVESVSKSEAIKIVRRQFERAGLCGTGLMKGRQYFSAKEAT